MAPGLALGGAIGGIVKRRGRPLLAVLVLIIALTAGNALGSGSPPDTESDPSSDGRNVAVEEIVVEARQFSFSPPIVRVAQGKRVRLTLRAMDVTHGLAVDDYGLAVMAIPGRPEQLEFTASKSGTFRLRCTQTCGPLHPFMAGQLIVTPSLPFPGALAIAFIMVGGTLAYLGFRRDPAVRPFAGGAVATAPAGVPVGGPGAFPVPISCDGVRHNVLGVPLLGRFLRWRGFQTALMLPLLFLLMLVVAAGLWGSPVGSHNLAIVFVWVLWWPLLIILLIPLGGRLWCALCPVPGPGEWLQRRSFVRHSTAMLSLGRRWPVRLRNMWLQNGAFIVIALLSSVVLTTPAATALVLVGFFALAVATSLVFQGRTFCRYVCPLGGFIGLCSLVAPFALRVKDKQVCRGHQGKECVKGSAAGYGCPWFEYPGAMDRNAYCGLCMECVKTCPKENIVVGLQAPGRDLAAGQVRLDEAYRTFIALGSGALYAAVMLGPWAWLKTLAGTPMSAGFALYAALLLVICLAVVPGLFLLAVWLSHRLAVVAHLTVRRLWQDFAAGLVPLALAVWIAFSVALVFASGHYLVPVISDPLGRGWNLFGTAGYEGGPFFMGVLPFLQAGIVLGGLGWSLGLCWRLAKRDCAARARALRALTPVAVFLLAAASTFLWLFLG